MVSLNTPAELLQEGFVPDQFGEDSAGWPIFAQALLDEQNLIVLERVGATNYASADAGIKNRIKRAERFLASAELWLRRMNKQESDVVLDGSDNKGQGFLRFKTNHESYMKKAQAEFAAVPAVKATAVEVSSGPAMGIVSTSHFEAAL